jgi:hypothetical protein
MATSTRSMRRRGRLWSQPSIRERRIRFIAGLLCAARGLNTRSGLPASSFQGDFSG